MRKLDDALTAYLVAAEKVGIKFLSAVDLLNEVEKSGRMIALRSATSAPRLIWRNTMQSPIPNSSPGISADPPKGSVEIVEIQQSNDHYSIWFAYVPARPADNVARSSAAGENWPERSLPV